MTLPRRLFLGALGTLPLTRLAAGQAAHRLTILHMNDFHSRHEPVARPTGAACRANDASQAQALLPRWGRAAFPHAGIHSASDLGGAAQDEELGAHIERLLASRYAANAAPCELGALLGRLEAARAGVATQRKRGARTDALPPLYAAPHAVAAQANMPTMRPIDQ